MFKNMVLGVLGLYLGAVAAQAEVREAASMREVLPAIGASTVVVFDLDNTVIEAAQMLGSDQFFEFMLEKSKTQGLVGEQAVAYTLEQVGKVQPKSKVLVVEPGMPAMIQALQADHMVLALTARPVEWRADTLAQLESVGVHFEHVLFLPKGENKGRYLVQNLAAMGVQPESLVFVDDKARNVQSVSDALDVQGGYPHIEFRYGAADAKVRAFDPRIAQCEWDYFVSFGVFLSDEQARTECAIAAL